MGNSNTVNVVTLLIVISVYGLVWGQYMYCPAQNWTLGSTITLRCYLHREDVPSECAINFKDRVTFRRRPFTGSGTDRCSVNNVTTTSCTSSSSECGCEPANATYFMVHHTFTVDADDDGTWECSVVCLSGDFVPVLTFTSDNCDNREVVAHAVLSTPTITVTTPATGSGWTVRGTVDITRIFSSTGDYSCMWSYRRDSGQYTDITSSTITTDPPASGTSVRTGRCDFSDTPLSSDPGTYTYSVTVSPGQTEKTGGSVVIETPAISSSNCNPSTGYVVENGEVTCTCNANVGQPAGRLRWFMESTAIEDGQYGAGTLTVRQTVNRNHHRNKLRCEVDWITDITGPNLTLQVAWGPDTVSIQGDNPFYTDTTGSLTLTLTSQATEVNPSSDLTYQWNIPCDVTQQSTCSFNPRPPGAGDNGDDNKVITCTVTNVHNNNKEQQGSLTLDLKYPPLSPPLVSGYDNNQILYQGDSLTLSCTVTGGDPVVNSVSLTCPGHEQDATNGQSSSLEISSLSDSDNNLVCVCHGHWVRESYYTLTDSRTLTVYYPPSSPVIRQTDGQSYPPLEGESVTLNCSLTSPGYPSAGITWLSERPAVNANPLQLSVDKGDNQRDVTCQASNEFTQHKGLELTDDFTLQVYYGPDITLSPAAGNKCTMTSDRTSCSVVEGERVHLQCNVASNPSPKNCSWSASHVTGPDLEIVSVNRTHSGVYQVQVNTTKPDNSDGRLPLRANSSLTVLVKYEPTETTLMVNRNVSITVNESEAVTLVCQSYGRPTPRLKLLQRGVVLASEDGGQLSLSEEMNHLPHNISAMCNNTGTFICQAGNDVGNGEEISAEVTVNCKPRSSGAEQVPKVNFRDNSVSVAFSLEAYPLPDRHSFHYLGSTLGSENSQQSEPENIELSATCTNTDAKYTVECNVTVDHVKDKSAEGFYLYTAGNDFGEASFKFQVTVNATGGGDGSGGVGIAIGAGIAAAVLVIVVVAVVVFLLRRKRKKRSKAPRHGHTTHQDEPEMIVNDLYGRSPGTADDDQEMMIVNDFYESSGNVAPQVAASVGASGGAYEEVSMDKGTNGVTKVQQQPGPSGAGADNVYAEVKKPKKSTPPAAAAANETTNVYAEVKKPKKSTPPAAAAANETTNVYAEVKKPKKSTPPAAAAANETTNVYAEVKKSRKSKKSTPPAAPADETTNLYAEVKKSNKSNTSTPLGKLDMSPRTAEPGPSARPKPAPKPKTKKGKQNKTAGQRAQEAEGAEYGNIAPPPQAANQAEGSVYENYGFQKDNSDPAGANALHARSEVPQAAQDDDGSRTVNADGLVYTTVAFTESQRQKEKKPAPEREFTEYAGLDFTKMAAETKKK